jgi:hypothetical protein
MNTSSQIARDCVRNTANLISKISTIILVAILRQKSPSLSQYLQANIVGTPTRWCLSSWTLVNITPISCLAFWYVWLCLTIVIFVGGQKSELESLTATYRHYVSQKPSTETPETLLICCMDQDETLSCLSCHRLERSGPVGGYSWATHWFKNKSEPEIMFLLSIETIGVCSSCSSLKGRISTHWIPATKIFQQWLMVCTCIKAM